MIYVTVLCLVTIVNTEKCDNRQTQLAQPHIRVQGGRDVKDGEFEYVVLLAYIAQFVHRWCSGSMLNERWTLTAAHCAESPPGVKDFYEYFSVWYGRFSESPIKTKLYSKILEFSVLPSYSKTELDKYYVGDRDICLVRVGSRIQLKSVGVVSAVDPTSLYGSDVLYVGGGAKHPGQKGNDAFDHIQVGEGIVIKCNRSYPKRVTKEICVASKYSYQKSLHGDSGSPLISDNKIIGVLSQEDKDVSINSVFAPVGPYVDWIMKTIRRM